MNFFGKLTYNLTYIRVKSVYLIYANIVRTIVRITSNNALVSINIEGKKLLSVLNFNVFLLSEAYTSNDLFNLNHKAAPHSTVCSDSILYIFLLAWC